MRVHRMGRRRSRGQALIELCILIPVCLTLFMGVYTAGAFISDMDIAGQATRAGARLGAEIGNCGYGTGSWTCSGSSTTDPTNVDSDMVTSVETIAKGLQNVTSLDEIDIYDPCGAAACTTSSTGNAECNDSTSTYGKYVSGQPVDIWKKVSGNWTFTNTQNPPSYPTNYTLDQRVQTHPTESELGVRLVFTYTSPTLRVFTQTDSQYSVIRLAPS